MAKAVIARRQGDEFQALFFWKQLVRLLIDDKAKTVIFESDQQIFVDDIIVEYSKPILEEQTGLQYQVDAYQCKYHVAQGTRFSIDKLISPKFIHSKHSMLQRLYDAYRQYSEKQESFRLHIVSSSGWDATDEFCQFLSPENHIRASFYEKGPRSMQGKMRIKFAKHLGISEEKLKAFLDLVRFDLGMNRKDIAENLDANLRVAGLLQLEKTVTNTRYAELAWKWLEQGIHSFDMQTLQRMVRKEKLVDANRKNLLVIRHQSLDPISPNAIHDDLPINLHSMAMEEIAIDATHLFVGGRLTDPMFAARYQQEKVREIIRLYMDNPAIEMAYYGIAHIPLVFWLGYQLNVRKPIHLFEHNRANNRWNLLEMVSDCPELRVRGIPPASSELEGDVVVKFGVSYPISDVDVFKVVPSSNLTIEITLPSPSPDIVRNINQVETYALTFRKILDAVHNLLVKVKRVHVFYAGPVSLAFRCGQLISPTIHPRVLVYNYFSQDAPRYKWGICVNASVDSPDFLAKL